MEKEFRKFMIDRGITINKICVILGCTYQTAHKKVNNPRLFTIDDLNKLQASTFINQIFN